MCAFVLCLRVLFVVWAGPTRRRAHLVRATVLPFAFRGSGSLIEPFCFKSQIKKNKKRRTLFSSHYSAMLVIMRRFNLWSATPSILHPSAETSQFIFSWSLHVTRVTGEAAGERRCLIRVNKIFGRICNWAQMWHAWYGLGVGGWSIVWQSWENSLSADLCFDKFIKYTRLLHKK